MKVTFRIILFLLLMSVLGQCRKDGPLVNIPDDNFFVLWMFVYKYLKINIYSLFFDQSPHWIFIKSFFFDNHNLIKYETHNHF